MAQIPNHSRPAALRNGFPFPANAACPPVYPALLAQLLALLAVILLAAAVPAQAQGQQPGHLQWALMQGVIAAAIAHRLGMAVWWQPVHLVFTPALVAALALGWSPLWFLGGFLLLALVYGKIHQTRAPLYLSSRAAVKALASLLPRHRGFSFIDLGSGCGGLLHCLRKARPDGNYHGVEAALLPFLLSKGRGIFGATGCRIRWGDFRALDLAPYDVVYAYLSPPPMTALWHKARREMRPGSIFVSNSFVVSGVTPELSLKLNDGGGSMLHLWRM